MTQEQFGEFLEDNLQDLVNPDPESVPGDRDMPSPAALIQMARNLRVHSKTEFERTINPHDGSGSLVFKKDNEVKGNTKVPPAFLLGIPVFEAGDMYRVEAKLRFRVEGAQARFFYELVRPELILKDAFDKVRAEARDKTGLRVLAGRPETQGTSADE